MGLDLPEHDWKTLSRLKPLALERLCQRFLRRVQDLLADLPEGEAHRAYLDLYKYIQDGDKVLANCFGDWRRSQALLILADWRQEELLTDEEFARFSPEAREKAVAQIRAG
ncbi:MAG: peptide ABC transporter substrate-binding protein [Chloroflexota bacterium]